ncbi:unannotated protein [freshwater metagenome]|uniref:Unannotated protein n=1 Tax=freshwater metagenome TaxID=449393 RepID=A0A6J6BJG3_9ZZZZ
MLVVLQISTPSELVTRYPVIFVNPFSGALQEIVASIAEVEICTSLTSLGFNVATNLVASSYSEAYSPGIVAELPQVPR